MNASTPTRFNFDLDLKKTDKTGFYEVINPIYAFKKVYSTVNKDPCIANLIIPVGATIFIGVTDGCKSDGFAGRVRQRVGHRHSGKLRATEAYVHSIVNRAACDHPLKTATSWFTMRSYGDVKPFTYRVGRTVRPTLPYDYQPHVCASGIHFFLTLDAAKQF